MSKNDGGSADYYQLPAGAAELQDLIEHKAMNFAVGNIFKAAYRLGAENSLSDRSRDLRKIMWFAERELQRLASQDDAAHKAPSICDSEVLDFSLPSIILECDGEACRRKYHEEMAEVAKEVVGSPNYLVEVWDTLQAAITWRDRCDSVSALGASMAVLLAENLLGSFTDYNKIRHAKTLTLVKNAIRNYYAPEVCKIILESNGERWR